MISRINRGGRGLGGMGTIPPLYSSIPTEPPLTVAYGRTIQYGERGLGSKYHTWKYIE